MDEKFEDDVGSLNLSFIKCCQDALMREKSVILVPFIREYLSFLRGLLERCAVSNNDKEPKPSKSTGHSLVELATYFTSVEVAISRNKDGESADGTKDNCQPQRSSEIIVFGAGTNLNANGSPACNHHFLSSSPEKNLPKYEGSTPVKDSSFKLSNWPYSAQNLDSCNGKDAVTREREGKIQIQAGDKSCFNIVIPTSEPQLKSYSKEDFPSASKNEPNHVAFKQPGVTGESTVTKDEGNLGSENDDKPPVNLFKPIEEPDSIYSVRCKLFAKKDSTFKEKGVGNLHIKALSRSDDDLTKAKYQLVVRADNQLGTLMLNLLIVSHFPVTRKSEKDILIVDPTGDKGSPLPILIRVKNGEESKKLQNKLEEIK